MIGKYTVLRDTKEQKNFWSFAESSECFGTVPTSLKTGDYTLKGFEDILCIERKWSTGEFAKNINEKRFERELDRMDCFLHSFLILEFDFHDIERFPQNSGIPKKFWPQLRVTPNYLKRRYTEIDLNHKAKIIFAGPSGGDARAEIIFRYVTQKYGRFS